MASEDEIRMSLKGSALSSLVGQSSTGITGPTTPQPPATFLSQNINTQNDVSSKHSPMDNMRVLDALGTIANKMERGFNQTNAILERMQVAITSRLESIHRQLLQMNTMMSKLYENQLKYIMQSNRTGMVRLAEMFSEQMGRYFSKMKEMMLTPYSLEAINMAMLRLTMKNRFFQRMFGYEAFMHSRRMKTMPFTYELYLTIKNMPKYFDNLATNIKTVNSEHNTKEFKHWQFVELHLMKILTAVDRWLPNLGFLRFELITVARFLESAMRQPGWKRARQSAYKNYLGFERKEDKRTQGSVDRAIISIDKRMKDNDKDDKKYRLKTVDIFEDLLKNTMSIKGAVGTLLSYLFVNPKSLIFKLVGIYMGTKVFAAIVRNLFGRASGFTNLLGDAFARAFVTIQQPMSNFFKNVLPAKIYDTMSTLFNRTGGMLKSWFTMMFGIDPEKRKQARSVFYDQIWSALYRFGTHVIIPAMWAVFAAYKLFHAGKGMITGAFGRNPETPKNRLTKMESRLKRMAGHGRRHSKEFIELMQDRQELLGEIYGSPQAAKAHRALIHRLRRGYNKSADYIGNLGSGTYALRSKNGEFLDPIAAAAEMQRQRGRVPMSHIDWAKYQFARGRAGLGNVMAKYLDAGNVANLHLPSPVRPTGPAPIGVRAASAIGRGAVSGVKGAGQVAWYGARRGFWGAMEGSGLPILSSIGARNVGALQAAAGKSAMGPIISLLGSVGKFLFSGALWVGAIGTVIKLAWPWLLKKFGRKSSIDDMNSSDSAKVRKGFATAVSDVIMGLFRTAKKLISGFFGGIKNLLTGKGKIWDMIIGIVKGIVSGFGEMFQSMLYSVRIGIGDWFINHHMQWIGNKIKGTAAEDLAKLTAKDAERQNGIASAMKAQEDIAEVQAEAQQQQAESASQTQTLVGQIHDYFYSGKFTQQVAQGAFMLGEGIRKIFDIAGSLMGGAKNGMTGFLSGFGQITGAFLKGMMGDQANGLINRAMSYAKARGWSGAVSILGGAKQGVLQTYQSATEIFSNAVNKFSNAVGGGAGSVGGYSGGVPIEPMKNLTGGMDVVTRNEGTYGSVNLNDNGVGTSLGLLQWNRDRGRDLLSRLYHINPTVFRSYMGKSMEQMVLNGGTGIFRFSKEDKTNFQRMMSNETLMRQVMFRKAQEDYSGYVALANRKGVTDPRAQVYFADVMNQYGNGASNWITSYGTDLGSLHNRMMATGKNLQRRAKTYATLMAIDPNLASKVAEMEAKTTSTTAQLSSTVSGGSGGVGGPNSSPVILAPQTTNNFNTTTVSGEGQGTDGAVAQQVFSMMLANMNGVNLF